MTALAGLILSGLLGSMYAATPDGSVAMAEAGRVVARTADAVEMAIDGRSPSAPSTPPAQPTPPSPESTLEPMAPIEPAQAEVETERSLLRDAEREIVDATTGVRLGVLVVGTAAEAPAADEAISAVTPVEVPVEAAVAAASATPTAAEPARAGRRAAARTRAARTRSRRASPAPPVGPRLHSDPGMHVIATARQMNARGERISGSCYTYIAEVYTRAGHSGWRNRRVVYQGNRNGPYADLSQVRPGDWLYIVNHPERTPVGTHSVLFVGWEDRARGYARVIEHGGWGAPRVGQERGYDISRTYRITRPTLRR